MNTDSSARRKLATPTIAMLPRIEDALSFLYLDIVRVVQDDTGVCAEITTPSRGTERVYIPTASLACVLLGPGVSVTTRAMATMARHGTTVVVAGAGGVRTYASTPAPNLTTRWLEAQVSAWADPAKRLEVATRMYRQRFGEDPTVAGASLERLRGLEGQRVKALYRILAKQHRVAPFKRSYDPADWDSQNPVNLALSSANSCLYGICHAAINAIGCSPALGFVHTGKQQSFVYDIGDLYKAELTVPLAFSLHQSGNPEAAARRSFRQGLRLFKLMQRIVADIQLLLDPALKLRVPQPDEALTHLWDPERGPLPSGVNYGHQ